MTQSDFPWYTGTGDNGTTSLIGGSRVAKYHEQPETYGTVDEASSFLGIARAFALDESIRHAILIIQRDLYKMMSELATPPGSSITPVYIDRSRIEWLEKQIQQHSENVRIPKEFILPGNSRSGAMLDTARTIIRRAERQCLVLYSKKLNLNSEIAAYLNRLSSLCFVMARKEDQLSGASVNLAKTDHEE